jgi:hypothetical protein
MNRAYKLGRNLDHVRGNADYDVWQVFENRNEKFDGLFWGLGEIKEIPSCQFKGKLKRLERIDYPRCQQSYPIMSARMIKTFQDLGSFKHQIFPIDIYDGENPKTHECLKNCFGLLHLPETFDVIDYEKSTYYDLPGGRKEINQIALKEPLDGYPPIFRVDNKLGSLICLCVSDEAKQELEKRHVTGIRFIPLIDS